LQGKRHPPDPKYQTGLFYLVIKGHNLETTLLQKMKMIPQDYYAILILSSYFILETLEDKLSLLILILPNPIFSLEFIVFDGLGVIKVDVLGMEHMGTEIEHCSLVNLCSFVLGSVYLGVVLHKVTDSFHEIAVFFLGLEELLLRKV
jgi:hypothetical protein